MTIAAVVLAGLPSSAESGPPVLMVSPDHGPIGTVVELKGQGCNSKSGSEVILSFEGGSPAGWDGEGIGRIPVDAENRWEATYRIPSQLRPIQQRGGGPVAPGLHRFYSHPFVCMADFTVTPEPAPQGSGEPDAQATQAKPQEAVDPPPSGETGTASYSAPEGESAGPPPMEASPPPPALAPVAEREMVAAQPPSTKTGPLNTDPSAPRAPQETIGAELTTGSRPVGYGPMVVVGLVLLLTMLASLLARRRPTS